MNSKPGRVKSEPERGKSKPERVKFKSRKGEKKAGPRHSVRFENCSVFAQFTGGSKVDFLVFAQYTGGSKPAQCSLNILVVRDLLSVRSMYWWFETAQLNILMVSTY